MTEAFAAFLALMVLVVAFLAATPPGRALVAAIRTKIRLPWTDSKTAKDPPQRLPVLPLETLLLGAIASALATFLFYLFVGAPSDSKSEADRSASSAPSAISETSATPTEAMSTSDSTPEASSSTNSPPILITLGSETYYDLKAVTEDGGDYVDVITGDDDDGIVEITMADDGLVVGCRYAKRPDGRTIGREFVVGTLDPESFQITDLDRIPVPRRYPCYAPDLSPDGEIVAFWCASDGQVNDSICSFRPGAPSDVTVLDNGLHVIGEPEWLPDGKRMLVSTLARNRSGPIYLIDDTGEILRRVIYEGDSPALSPDGRTIALASEDGLFLYPLNPRPGDQARRLTVKADFAPAWSPDGSKIAYIGAAYDRDFGNVFVIDVRTGRRSDSYRYIEGFGSPNDLAW